MNVGGYHILRRIGEGAYGKVYLARKGGKAGFRTYYALKRLRVERRGDEAFEHYLLREARLGGLVNHPMLVRIHEVLRLDGEYVLVMDYVEGVTLRDVLGRRRGTGQGLGREVALELGADALDALHYGHTLRDPEGNESGFVHRDVKPGNIMLTPGGSMKLMDFGVARLDDAPSGTQQGELRGTIAYMAPEQAAGEDTTPAADQFAAALIVLEMLTGDPAWGDLRGPGILARVVAGDVSSGLAKISIDDPVRPVLERMLAVSPPDRYATAHDAALALRELRATLATRPALPAFVKEELLWFEEHQGGTDPVPSWSGSEAGSGADAPPAAASKAAASAVEDDEEDLYAEASRGRREYPAAGLYREANAGVQDRPGSGPWSEGASGFDGEGTWTDLAAISDPAAVSLREEMPAPLPPPASLGVGRPASELAPLEAAASAEPQDDLDLDALDEVPAAAPLPEPAPDEADEPRPPDPESTLPIGSRASVSAAALAAAEAERAPRPPSPVTSTAAPPMAWSERTLPFTGVPGPPPARPAAEPAGGGILPPHLGRTPDLPRRAPTTIDLVSSPLLSALAGGLLVCLIFLLAWLVFRDATGPDADAGPDPTPSDAEALAAADGPRRPVPTAGILVEDLPEDEAPPTPSPASDLDPADEARPAAVVDPADEARLAAVVDPAEERLGEGTPEPAASPPPRRFVEDASAEVPPEEREQVLVVEAPTPAAEGPRPGDVVEEQDPLARTPRGIDARRTTAEKEAAAEAERKAAEEAGVGGRAPLDALEAGVPSTAGADGPSLRFLSSAEQPLAVPLSLRVRPEGFLATSVSVYYQWRSEGSSGRRKRSLRRQGDGSYALDISTSELRADRLQLWFVAEPDGVDLGSAEAPIEVRVR